MLVRDLTPEDLAAVAEIHRRRGLDYALPDLGHPLFFVKKAAVRDGELAGALVLKLCAETMLLLGDGDPREKMQAMRELQAAVLDEAYRRGLDEIHAAVPEIGFDRRLRELGWQRDRPGWHLWTRSTR